MIDSLSLQEACRLGSYFLSLIFYPRSQVISLSALRGTARVVVVAGTSEQVQEAMDKAAPFREELMRRGVFVVPLPVYDSTGAVSKDALGLGTR